MSAEYQPVAPADPSPRSRLRRSLVGGAVVVILGIALAAEIVATRPVRLAMANYTALIAAANRQDIDAVRRLCTARYLRTHTPRPTDEGGVIGLPRNVHKNFQAWRHGPSVWLCPTNRVGPLYQFVFEDGSWRFDGPIGILRPRGEVVPLADLMDVEGLSPEDADAAPENPR
jgi:hypothetical protein